MPWETLYMYKKLLSVDEDHKIHWGTCSWMKAIFRSLGWKILRNSSLDCVSWRPGHGFCVNITTLSFWCSRCYSLLTETQEFSSAIGVSNVLNYNFTLSMFWEYCGDVTEFKLSEMIRMCFCLKKNTHYSRISSPTSTF